MHSTRHPRADELESYLLNRLYPLQSVRVAKHLLSCSPCMERAAELGEAIDVRQRRLNEIPADTPVQRLCHAWSNPASGLPTAVTAILLLSVGIGPLLLPWTRAENPAAVLSAGVPVEFGPVPEPAVAASTEPVIADEPPVRVAKVRAGSRNNKPQRHPAKPFIAPDAAPRAYEVGYLPPPRGPVVLPTAPAALELTAVSTEVGPRPTWPVKGKRHPLVRFFGAIAKPFRSDRT